MSHSRFMKCSDEKDPRYNTGDVPMKKISPILLLPLLLVLLLSPRSQAVAQNEDDLLDGPAYFNRRTKKAIDKSLEYLADAQNPDGSCAKKNPAAMTAVTIIAFMVNGHVPGEKPYGEVLDRGIDYLLKSQDEGGYIGSSMYAHGLATLALSEVWGMTERDDEVKDALKSAVQLILHAQNKEGGWRYWPRPMDADVSVTAMQVVALASAKQAGIVVADKTIKDAIRYCKMCYDPATGGFNYQPRPYSAPAFPRTAAAVTALMMCGKYDADEVKGGVKYLLNAPESKFKKIGHYSYAHYYAIQVMYRSGSERFSEWYPKIRDALLSKMNAKGGISTRGNKVNSTVYATAMGLIVLGSPCHFVPAYQR